MKKALLIGSAVVAALAVPAIAAHVEGRTHPRPDMTRAQVEAKVGEMFARADANKDGAVTREEMSAQRDAMRARMKDEHFKRLDGNGDGSITRAEFDAGHAAMREHRTEMREQAKEDGRPRMMMKHGGGGHMGGGMMGGRMFDMADANRDGRITLAEARAAALTHFDQADANKDGTVTSDERAGMWKAKMREWRDKADKAS